MNIQQTMKRLSAVALLAGLAACGGGGISAQGPAANDREVPASAGQSNAAFVAFLGVLATRKDDTSEGLTMDSFAAPSSEVEEPIGLGG